MEDALTSRKLSLRIRPVEVPQVLRAAVTAAAVEAVVAEAAAIDLSNPVGDSMVVALWEAVTITWVATSQQ